MAGPWGNLDPEPRDQESALEIEVGTQGRNQGVGEPPPLPLSQAA